MPLCRGCAMPSWEGLCALFLNYRKKRMEKEGYVTGKGLQCKFILPFLPLKLKCLMFHHTSVVI